MKQVPVIKEAVTTEEIIFKYLKSICPISREYLVLLTSPFGDYILLQFYLSICSELASL